MADGIAARLRLIGRMEAWTVSGESILPPERTTRALLSAIALAAPRPASRRWLTGLLWSRRSAAPERSPLRQELRRLSDALAPAGKGFLVSTRNALLLSPGTVWSDVWEIRQATAESPGSLSLLDGELLEDLDGVDPAFDIWLKRERELLHDYARGVAEADLLAQHEPVGVIVAARRLLLIDPVHERCWRALMRAYAEQGDRTMAIEAYEQCRAALLARIDAEPSVETRELLADIRSARTVRPRQAPPARVGEPSSAGPFTDGIVTPSGPRAGVLPLRCIGMAEEESFLGPGLAQKITSALSRFYRVIVIDADELARFARDNRDEAEIRRVFGIDYLVDGTIQRDRDRLRISLLMLDLRANNQVVWAERFDRTGNDLTAIEDEVAAAAVARVEPELQLIEAMRNPRRPEAELSANELLLLTIPPMTRMDRAGFARAGERLEMAVAREPDYCGTHVWYAFWHVLLVSQGWAADPRRALVRGGQLSERGVLLNPLAVRALTIAGLLRSYLAADLRDAADCYDHALRLNPNLAMTWALSAVTCANMGDLAEAERRFDTYKALAPHDRLAFVFDTFFAPINLIRRDYQAAVAAGPALIQLNPAFSAGYKPYLAALGHLGRHQEAAPVLRRLLAIEPDFTVHRFLDTTAMRSPDDREHFVQGLMRAGVR